MYQNIPTKVLTGVVRLSYANLVTPRVNKQGDDPKYSVTLLIPKTDNATKMDIVPTALIDVKDLDFPDDLEQFVPDSLGEVFLRQEYSKATRLKGRSLWAVLKMLEEMRVIRRVENDGKCHRYCRVKYENGNN